MPLLNPLPIEIQNSAIESHTLKGIVHLAIVLAESYERFWNLNPEINELLSFTGRTPEVIVADLNADYALANTRNTKHYVMASQVNEWLAEAGHPLRVPIVMPEGYSNDGSAFAYTAPVVAAPEPVEEA
jgi:hypothetical protein